MIDTFAVDLSLIYDWHQAVQDRLKYRWNIRLPYEYCSFPIPEVSREVNEDILDQIRHNANFFKDLRPSPETLPALATLRKYGEIHVVSGRVKSMIRMTTSSLVRDFGDILVNLDPKPGETSRLVTKGGGVEWVRELRVRGVNWAFDDDPSCALEYAKRRIHCFLIRTPFMQHKTVRPNRFILEAANLAAAVRHYVGLFQM